VTLLAEVAVFLAAAVVAVPLFRRLGLGAVLGYLVAGVVVGPWGLRLITDVTSIRQFAEFGVVLLLFVMGLQLQPARLWVLRRSVFGLGSAQVGATAALIAGAALALGVSWQAACVIGFGLAMSSTAFVLQVLAERNQLTARFGRSSFAILLFQDLAVIPLLAIIPLLGPAGSATRTGGNALLSGAIALSVIVAVVVAGRLLLRPVLQVIARTRIQEIFTAAALLVVIGVALLMSGVGLSMSLGAFLAGVLLADSEFRHELEANIEPFKGLLLGLFFISVGMSVDLGLIASRPGLVIAGVVGLMLVKALVLYAVGRAANHDAGSARSLAATLAQGGEFAFVLFNLAAANGVMERELVGLLVVIVSLSMAATPLALALNDALARRLHRSAPAPAFDDIQANEDSSVIIAGFGRVGQIVARILLVRGIGFTALDISTEQVETVRKFGRTVYFGDASRLDLLIAARAENARLFVLAIDDVEASIRTAETVHRHFPHLRILARARNRFHAYRLMDLGVELIERETLLGSLNLARGVLQELGVPVQETERTIERFRMHDAQTLQRQHAVYHDERQLIQTSREAAAELQGLFESDIQNGERAAGDTFSPSDVR
jgi:glutathione-regulated potassium-efflux system ancillary protein KefC/glutathione-regulated potassium-efflux system protein KefB